MSHPHNKGLITIGIFKLLKAVFFVAMGLGALHFIAADLSETVHQVTAALRFDPDSRFVDMVQEKADEVTDRQLRIVSVGTFSYAGVALTEGVGLLLEQTWAEYLTLIIGIAFLPWEGFELLRRATMWRASVMLINLAIVAYLLWFVRERLRQRNVAEDSSEVDGESGGAQESSGFGGSGQG